MIRSRASDVAHASDAVFACYGRLGEGEAEAGALLAEAMGLLARAEGLVRLHDRHQGVPRPRAAVELRDKFAHEVRDFAGRWSDAIPSVQSILLPVAIAAAYDQLDALAHGMTAVVPTLQADRVRRLTAPPRKP